MCLLLWGGQRVRELLLLHLHVLLVVLLPGTAAALISSCSIPWSSRGSITVGDTHWLPVLHTDVALPLLLLVPCVRDPNRQGLEHRGLHRALHIKLVQGQQVVVAVCGINVDEDCGAAGAAAAANRCAA